MKEDCEKRYIWSCRETFPSFANCYTNTVSWNAADDTVLLAFPDDGTVVEIDRKTGTMVGQYGNASGSYAFSPSTWQLQFPHSPTITPQGTLLLSTHLPAYPFGTPAAPEHHAFAEFTIDRANLSGSSGSTRITYLPVASARPALVATARPRFFSR